MADIQQCLFVVTGGNGFIGSHVAAQLTARGHLVRVVDITARRESFEESICAEEMIGNLCDQAFCDRAVRGAHTVLHFAATMGGMGTIHSENNSIIYEQNHTMTQHLLAASLDAGVTRFFYASSACVYPEGLQDDASRDVSLKEEDVWAQPPPNPQGLYGLEKLNSELLVLQSKLAIDVRIARFHNVYGPRGAWMNGREKVPAALIRKALAAKLLGRDRAVMEIWGDGNQRRSFVFIDDCVEAVLRLLDSNHVEPLNIGSDEAVTVSELARLTLQAADLDVSDVDFRYDSTKPVGVSARNSNNDTVSRVLSWKPCTTLESGIMQTTAWIADEMKKAMDGLDEPQRIAYLEGLQRSKVVNLKKEWITFAVLLPITSRGTSSPQDCLINLRAFARSLHRTTYRDTHVLGDTRYQVKIYLAIDEDDGFLAGADENKAAVLLREEGFSSVVTHYYAFPKGHVCRLWAASARKAWEDACDYFVLLGDDVQLHDEGWMRDTVAAFADLALEKSVPEGFGCVTFTDVSFPGMPTFPIVSRVHMNIFEGKVVPASFINQDGDPFLFQLYRRWSCSRMFSSRISNAVGGSGDARYNKQHAVEWTLGTLDKASNTVERWLQASGCAAKRELTLDVIIPCYRVDLRYLDPILSLVPSKTCSVMFIVIVDDPSSHSITELQHRYGARVEVRIRVNSENLGASASRNRGLSESAAEWAYFLDDDVSPQPDLLVEAERAIRSHPEAAGFVGNALFPPATNVFTSAVHLAGVTYFWDIAAKISHDVPWGVTANLIARRNIPDGVRFDLQFPKTGGGEDIDFCRRKREYALQNGGGTFVAAPRAVVTHPWWNNGRRSYWRFYKWSKGDGGLIKKYSTLSYRDRAPNSAELILANAALLLYGLIFPGKIWVLPFAGCMAISIIAANVLHDMYRHLWRDVARTRDIHSSLGGAWWVAAVVESSLIRMFSEWGRVIGFLERREYWSLGYRFNWFAGRAGSGPVDEERMNSVQRFLLVVVFFRVLILFFVTV
ncbi:glycosyltransferase family 2 protein [Artomyces pyxidatus]|uniref:Glycosyltransferase family 2 protein n=1 Tax=Artomyces pyxidatus TaxID=48021 RepID=A0ACB8TGU0_9AGAM|nr:glycosyltransferase family 2 protein [Artomyces pyxidatus]